MKLVHYANSEIRKMASFQKVHDEPCIMEIFLDKLNDADFLPLMDMFTEIDSSEVDAVDILHESPPCILFNEEPVLSLIHKINQKLRVVDLQGLSFGKDFLRSNSVVSEGSFLPTSQFSAMDNAFNDRFSDEDVVATSEFLQSTTEESSDESELDFSIHWQQTGNWVEVASHDQEEFIYPTGSGATFTHNNHESATFDDFDMTSLDGFANLDELCNNFPLGKKIPASQVFSDYKERLPSDDGNFGHTVGSSNKVVKKYISYHSSPICFEKHYRQFMIASLPLLKVLDNLPIRNDEKERAKIIVSQDYEYLPYNRQGTESVVHILHKREMGSGIGLQKSTKLSQSYSSRKSLHLFSKSISAAKVGSTAWPVLQPISKLRSISREETKKFRPRQFEYHPRDPSLMVFGTLDGELVVINHESGRLVGYLASLGALHSILGLSWLKKHPYKLIAGSDNGSLQLYDVRQMPSMVTERYCDTAAPLFNFDNFEQLTSVHVNSMDEWFLASGYSKHVALYDIDSGRCLQVLKHLHQEHINVVKFAHHSPSVFATSSFDRDIKLWDLRQRPLRPCYTATSSRGNVMVCFSPDDHYLLSSAVDNEVCHALLVSILLYAYCTWALDVRLNTWVNQLLAVDGRLHMKLNITSTGSAQNYTRSYYMNGRDYIISGSCEENVVRICCAKTGRRLRDISLEVWVEAKKDMKASKKDFRTFISLRMLTRIKQNVIKGSIK
ncbi:hypothetical protein ACLOJK_003687, partial [Asimina triloba]